MSAVIAGTSYPLPTLALVKELLTMLFDGMSVKAGAKLDVSPKAKGYCAVYVTDAGAPGAVCCCDMAFAANSGAALSLLPPPVAKEAVRDNALTPVMLANLHEVMNICTRLVLKDDSPHLKLRELTPIATLAAPAAAILSAPKGRIDFEVTIAKYGPGILSILSL